MGWPEKHLHWTLMLACLVITVANLLADASLPHELQPWLTVVIAYGLPLIPCAWVLRQKGQSLWWLPVIWIPFAWWMYAVLYIWPPIPFIGWVVPFVLQNRRQASPHVHGGEDALAMGEDGPAEPETIALQTPGPGLAVRIAGFVAGLYVAGCGIFMLKYVIGQVSVHYHGKDQVAYPVAVALSLFLVASLLIMPQRMYRERRFVRNLAAFMSVCLLVGGTLAVLGGLLALIVGSGDPGWVLPLLGYTAIAAGIPGLISGGVLYARVRATRKNLPGSCPPGSVLVSPPASG